ncbi:hypothetical protein [Flavobacterium ginsenosidimutans]|uniref:Uncharacterized protein n=1 Tax=Flavobacterium ginsenosidimutans TaxID=687844 RepID=A0ABZ2Q4W9_9FLAO|nr:hypothetical protein [Flavobacterium ginsenosidimutans]KAF2326493.1 hypothetical protein DM444_21620 [Flavobacterium ginsenosidimutans]
MKLYDLCIVVEHLKKEWNGQFAIIIEDFYPDYFLVELWTFEENNEVEMTSLLTNNLRLATKEEMEEYQIKFKEYCRNKGYS